MHALPFPVDTEAYVYLGGCLSDECRYAFVVLACVPTLSEFYSHIVELRSARIGDACSADRHTVNQRRIRAVCP